jgi:hypothetical protein
MIVEYAERRQAVVLQGSGLGLARSWICGHENERDRGVARRIKGGRGELVFEVA